MLPSMRRARRRAPLMTARSWSPVRSIYAVRSGADCSVSPPIRLRSPIRCRSPHPGASYSRDGAAAAGTGARGAAEAVSPDHDRALLERGPVEITNVTGRGRFHRQLEHLIEVAVVKGAVPTDRQGVSAHDAPCRRRIECSDQTREISLEIVRFDQPLEKAADGHVGNGIERVE